MKTELLGLEIGDIKDKWRMEVESNFYWMIFQKWWDHFGLEGEGLIIGHQGKHSDVIKDVIKSRYPSADPGTVDLQGADITWDITEPLFVNDFNFIICQAVLEHVKDPVAAVGNLGRALTSEGNLYIHTHGPRKRYHREPIDCWRFMPDSLQAIADATGLCLIDKVWTPENCFAIYRRSE